MTEKISRTEITLTLNLELMKHIPRYVTLLSIYQYFWRNPVLTEIS
jgi:hypothetical protein